MSQIPPVVFLMGPTASGKSDLAMALAEELPVEIVSVDATCVYRGLDIGAAKPSAAERAAVPHHLIDIRDPADPYSAAQFRIDAQAAIDQIHAAGRIPLLVGGTMLYFKVLLEGLADLPGADPDLRAELEAEAARHGWPHLHAQLAEVDPDTAARLHPNHSQRILRALEVYRLSGLTMSELRQRQTEQSEPGFAERYRLTQLALAPLERAVLHRRIEQRFELMLERGLVDEVKALHARGDLSPELPAVRAVGYRQVWDYLEGHTDYAEMIDRGVAATRQLAKRQLTWLRRWPDARWLYTEENGGIDVKNKQIRDRALNYIAATTI